MLLYYFFFTSFHLSTFPFTFIFLYTSSTPSHTIQLDSQDVSSNNLRSHRSEKVCLRTKLTADFHFSISKIVPSLIQNFNFLSRILDLLSQFCLISKFCLSQKLTFHVRILTLSHNFGFYIKNFNFLFQKLDILFQNFKSPQTLFISQCFDNLSQKSHFFLNISMFYLKIGLLAL